MNTGEFVQTASKQRSLTNNLLTLKDHNFMSLLKMTQEPAFLSCFRLLPKSKDE